MDMITIRRKLMTQLAPRPEPLIPVVTIRNAFTNGVDADTELLSLLQLAGINPDGKVLCLSRPTNFQNQQFLLRNYFASTASTVGARLASDVYYQYVMTTITNNIVGNVGDRFSVFDLTNLPACDFTIQVTQDQSTLGDCMDFIGQSLSNNKSYFIAISSLSDRVRYDLLFALISVSGDGTRRSSVARANSGVTDVQIYNALSSTTRMYAGDVLNVYDLGWAYTL